MGGGLESRCVGRVCGADGAVCSMSWEFHFDSTKNFGEIHTEGLCSLKLYGYNLFKTEEPNHYKPKVYYQFSFLLRVS
jgi:hypothetical protein